MKKRLSVAVTMFLAMVAGAWADGFHYTYDRAAYPDEHVIFVALADGQGNWLEDYNFTDGSYFLGAFIGEECRGEAELSFTNETTGLPYESKNLFMIRVHGNDDASADAGKTITFRIFRTSMNEVGTSSEYIIPSTNQSVPFQREGLTGTASDPISIHFMPAVNVMLPETITANFGDTINLFDHIIREPERALIPYPLSWFPNDTSYISIVNDTLLAITNIPEENYPLSVYLNAGEGMFQLNAKANIAINNPAKSFAWIQRDRMTVNETDASKASITIGIDQSRELSAILSGFNVQGDSTYTLTGRYEGMPATTHYTWTSSNEDVIAQAPTGGYEIKKVGTDIILKGTPDDGSTETSPTLIVTVVKPVTGFTFGTSAATDTVVVVQVGDNITERLKTLVNAVPADATNPKYSIVTQSTEYFGYDDNNNLIAKAITSEGTGVVTTNVQLAVVADDGFYAVAPLWVVVIPQQPTKIEAVEATLSLKTPEEYPADITSDLYGNLKLTPDTMNISDFASRISIVPSDAEVIGRNGENMYGMPIFELLKKGQATIEVTLPVLNNLDITTEGDPTGAVESPMITINTKELTVSFKVEVHDGLSEFTLASQRTTVGESVSITLVPQPLGVTDFVTDNIQVEVIPAEGMPEGWTFAEVEGKGLNWTITPKSVGNGTIIVNYTKDADPMQMGQNTINVDQQLVLSSGWQWSSLFQGSVNGKDAMKDIFGQNLFEIRADEGLLYNDSIYGYFGDLNRLDTLKTYKVRMKNLPAPTPYTIRDYSRISSYFVNNCYTDTTETGAPKPLSIPTRKGWNWIGNPYQYYQNISDIFPTDTIQFAVGDIIKGKTSFTTYKENGWEGTLKYLTPGEGYLIFTANEGSINFVPEFALKQQAEAPAAARTLDTKPMPWTIDHHRFADNMSMIAHVGGLSDEAALTLYAFVGSECRGRGVAVGDNQFITIHGEKGERFTFCVYDEKTDQFYEIRGSRAFAPVSGTVTAPVPLYAGEVLSVEAITNTAALDGATYDLQGRRIDNPTRKGIYVQRGRKVVK